MRSWNGEVGAGWVGPSDQPSICHLTSRSSRAAASILWRRAGELD